MTRIVPVAALLTVLAAPAQAQWVVHDPGNFEQAVLIAERTLREYQVLWDQYQTILRMAQGLGNMDRYRIPTIATTFHDAGRWEYGRPWLQGMNSGDATGSAYGATTRRLERPNDTLPQLPAAARQALEKAYATVEITDSVAAMGGHQVALVRGYSGQTQRDHRARRRCGERARALPRNDRHPRQGGRRGTHWPAARHGHEPIALTHARTTPRARQAPSFDGDRRLREAFVASGYNAS